MIRIVFLILISGIPCPLLSQSKPCTLKEYKVGYIDTAIVADSINAIYIHFSSGFSERAKVYYNDKLVFRGKLITNFSLGVVRDVGIECIFPDLNNGGVLRIELLKSRVCGEFQLERNYRCLGIHNGTDEWRLNYYNVPYSIE